MKVASLFDLTFGPHDLKNPIPVRVSPQASCNSIHLVHLPDGTHRVHVKVTCPAEQGKANQTMLKLLAKALDTSVSCLSVVRGHHTRDKWVAWQHSS